MAREKFEFPDPQKDLLRDALARQKKYLLDDNSLIFHTSPPDRPEDEEL